MVYLKYMEVISKKKLDTLISCYVMGKKSAREISHEMNIPIDFVYRILKKNNISRRSTTEQNKIRFERKKPSFTVKESDMEDSVLFIGGVLLYWCEGAQWEGGNVVDFANSNTEMILLFLLFLRRICHVDEKRIRCYLYCYSNQDIPSLIDYWSHVMAIPREQFSKPYVRCDFDEKKTGKMPNGLIHVRYSDKKLLLALKGWIQDVPRKIVNIHGRLPK